MIPLYPLIRRNFFRCGTALWAGISFLTLFVSPSNLVGKVMGKGEVGIYKRKEKKGKKEQKRKKKKKLKKRKKRKQELDQENKKTTKKKRKNFLFTFWVEFLFSSFFSLSLSW